MKKYEPYCFSGISHFYPTTFTANLTGPDQNGNYTITYEGYEDGNISNYDCYCKTIYGVDWRNNKGEIKNFYFKREPYVYVALVCSSPMNINGIVYDNVFIADQIIYTINMSNPYNDEIILEIYLSSKYPGGSFGLSFFDNTYNLIFDYIYDDNFFNTNIKMIQDADYWFEVDEKNSKCIISQYSNTLVDVGYMNILNASLYEIKSTGWYDNTLYTGSGLHMTDGLELPPGQKISFYQIEFNFTQYGYTKKIYVIIKLKNATSVYPNK